MKKRLTALLLCISLLAGCQKAADPAPLISQDPVFPASTQEETFEDQDQRRQENSADPIFVSGLQGFSAQLASQLLSGSEKNVCFSPMSLSMALSLMTSGAEGETKDQLLQALGVDGQDSAWLADQNARLFRYLWQDQEDAVLKIANSIWVDESASLKPEFASQAAEQFYASTREVDYSNTQEVSQQMSQWIGEHTGNLLHPEINVTPEQQLTLINTLYFNTKWRGVAFLPQNTHEGTFTTNLGEEK